MHWWPRHTPSTGTPCAGEVLDRGVRQTGVLGSTGAGRDQQPVGPELDHLVEGDAVVAVDDRLGAELPEVLHEVVDERVVVVDDEDARAHPLNGTHDPAR